ncbi:hypothetical protein ERJ75_000123500 [Trypanosoma vivax]|uniref:65 kDa invariant surface glycoprotein n=1 Tax=Trypanosoma vivax (strain Y486) TaxID=1055687 RepID=F9WTM5_TRYVY|nr:hypothetical protein ERJ75_000123500 [Trypanosoma vivax]CCD20919.1 hypothetical protein, conserved in T.vivax [Trypanosoma vivax Y486]|eukprot:CCD20919.1 hypothetical protein, conserved in T.vivax [Trypanosoma vivax Y486]
MNTPCWIVFLFAIALCSGGVFHSSIAAAQSGESAHKAACEVSNMFLKMQTVFTVFGTYTSKTFEEAKKLSDRAWTLKNTGIPKEAAEAAMETSGDAWNDAKRADDGVKNALKDLEKFGEEARRGTYNYLDHDQIGSNFGKSFGPCENIQNYYKTTEEQVRGKIGSNLENVGNWSQEEVSTWNEEKLIATRLGGTDSQGKYEKLNEDFKNLVKKLKTNLTDAAKNLTSASTKIVKAKEAVEEAAKLFVSEKATECQKINGEGAGSQADDKKRASCEKFNEKLKEIQQKRGHSGGDAQDAGAGSTASGGSVKGTAQTGGVVGVEAGEDLMDLVDAVGPLSDSHKSTMSTTNIVLATVIPVVLLLMCGALFAVLRGRTKEKKSAVAV